MKDMEAKEDFVTRQIGGETIIVPVRGGVGDLNSIYTLNAPGADIWQMMRAGKPVPEIAAAVCREYEVSTEEATQDIVDFMNNLRASGLHGSLPENGG